MRYVDYHVHCALHFMFVNTFLFKEQSFLQEGADVLSTLFLLQIRHIYTISLAAKIKKKHPKYLQWTVRPVCLYITC